jgi:hypothetical protein
VTIHDQDLLLDYEKQGKFATQPSEVTYIFVGRGPIDKLDGIKNIVVARDLADNIEDHKYLVDFTSWYAIVCNDIAIGDVVSLIQYDVVISPDFCSGTASMMAEHPQGILGYSPVPMKSRDFVRDNMGYAPLRAAVKQVYGLDIKPLLRMYQRNSTDKEWPATNNVAMSRETLRDFVRWFTPLALAMGNHKPVGHAFERAIKVYSILSGRKNTYAPELLRHYQLNSHQTQDFVRDDPTFRENLVQNKN